MQRAVQHSAAVTACAQTARLSAQEGAQPGMRAHEHFSEPIDSCTTPQNTRQAVEQARRAPNEEFANGRSRSETPTKTETNSKRFVPPNA